MLIESDQSILPASEQGQYFCCVLINEHVRTYKVHSTWIAPQWPELRDFESSEEVGDYEHCHKKDC